ncbi:MAG: hypothetical protein HZB43_05945 [candidate division Zixibacteria bacterium]|nr:hypothetical protein [candidate division Zixibacteria bacterium]
MRVRYILSMENLRVHGELIESLVVDWEDDTSHEEIMKQSQKWITSRNFLTDRMNGLTEVGESSLTIEPIDAEAVNGIQELSTSP